MKGPAVKKYYSTYSKSPVHKEQRYSSLSLEPWAPEPWALSPWGLEPWGLKSLSHQATSGTIKYHQGYNHQAPSSTIKSWALSPEPLSLEPWATCIKTLQKYRKYREISGQIYKENTCKNLQVETSGDKWRQVETSGDKWRQVETNTLQTQYKVQKSGEQYKVQKSGEQYKVQKSGEQYKVQKSGEQ